VAIIRIGLVSALWRNPNISALRAHQEPLRRIQPKDSIPVSALDRSRVIS